jgi:hypothetical protein
MSESKPLPKITKSTTPEDFLGPCTRCARDKGRYAWHFDDGHVENICLKCCHEALKTDWGIFRRRVQ